MTPGYLFPSRPFSWPPHLYVRLRVLRMFLSNRHLRLYLSSLSSWSYAHPPNLPLSVKRSSIPSKAQAKFLTFSLSVLPKLCHFMPGLLQDSPNSASMPRTFTICSQHGKQSDPSVMLIRSLFCLVAPHSTQMKNYNFSKACTIWPPVISLTCPLFSYLYSTHWATLAACNVSTHPSTWGS